MLWPWAGVQSGVVKADFLEHLARCTLLEELEVEVVAPSSHAPAQLLARVTALAACRRLRTLKLWEGTQEAEDSTLCAAEDLLAGVASLLFLEEVGG